MKLKFFLLGLSSRVGLAILVKQDDILELAQTDAEA